jgi:hypothetical protein
VAALIIIFIRILALAVLIGVIISGRLVSLGGGVLTHALYIDNKGYTEIYVDPAFTSTNAFAEKSLTRS